MNITIVCGFHLPVPAVAGGAVEKMWWRMARLYAQRGHRVTLISRRWANWPADEMVDGVHLLRVPGSDHRRKLWQNLVLDAQWGQRVLRALPDADILITNTIFLPIYARQLRPGAGLLVVNLNRYPKGQVRWYRRAARIQAASGIIASAAADQAPQLAGRIRLVPNPVDTSQFSGPRPAREASAPLSIGFMGRIHPEKGLRTLAHAAERLAAQRDLPAWRILLRGPVDVAHGGGGPEFEHALRAIAPELWHDGRLAIARALNNPAELAAAYRALDVFCYPTEAAEGEAHPVAVLEAMASGLPVVATDLPCFADQLRAGENALLVPPGDAPALGDALARLLRNPGERAALGARAAADISTLDDVVIADQHLADFEQLLHASRR